ncbi:MAG: hypothetical protein ACRD07_19025 [Acidimicrobiales bacterium]
MLEQVSSILEPLNEAIDNLDLRVDNSVLIEAFALADRLNANCSTRSVTTTSPRCGAPTAPPP